MLVSVLVDRYQRVYARKLYIKEDFIDFLDYSEDENNDGDNKADLNQLRRRSLVIDFPDPDARAKANAAFEKGDTTNTSETTDTLPTFNILGKNENRMDRPNSSVRFIIGYVDDKNHETSHDLLETISSVVAQKQSAGDNIHINIVNDEQQQSSPYDVRFDLSMPSDEEMDDDNDELTEIVHGRGSKGNVLKKFQYSSRSKDQLDKPE